MNVRVLIVFWAGLATVGLSAEDAPLLPRGLEGTWHADVSSTQSLVLKIQATQMEMFVPRGDQRQLIWSGKISVSNESPESQMDWIGAKPYPNNRCLYRLRGDTLIVIGGGPDKRPTAFLSGPGAEPKVLVFTRSGGKPE